MENKPSESESESKPQAEPQPEPQAEPKPEPKPQSLDQQGMGHLLQSVTGKYSSQLNFSLDDSCEKLLLDYMNEVALAAVEQAAMLAEHRGALVVEEKDIQLVLSKKLDIPVPGAAHSAALYKNSYHVMNPKIKVSSKHKSISDSSNNNKRGVKRKSNQ